jgi:hypothetical protein
VLSSSHNYNQSTLQYNTSVFDSITRTRFTLSTKQLGRFNHSTSLNSTYSTPISTTQTPIKHAFPIPSPCHVAQRRPQHGGASPLRPQPHHHGRPRLARRGPKQEASKDKYSVSILETPPYLLSTPANNTPFTASSPSTQSSSGGLSAPRGGSTAACDFI